MPGGLCVAWEDSKPWWDTWVLLRLRFGGGLKAIFSLRQTLNVSH